MDYWKKLFQAWTKRTPKQLRLAETLALGERQFVSIIEFGAERYLIGRTPSSLSVLAQLPANRSITPAHPGDTLAEPL